MTDRIRPRERRQKAEPWLLGVCANFADRSGFRVTVIRIMWCVASVTLTPVVTMPVYILTWWLTKEE